MNTLYSYIYTNSVTRLFAAVTILSLLFSAFPAHIFMANAQTVPSTEETVTVHLEKKFSGPVPDGYTADMFSFKVTGTTASSGDSIDETVTLSAYTDDTANNTIDLPKGSYTVEEIGPIDFVPSEWRPGWYGDACVNGSDFSTVIEIDDNNIDHGTIYCQVDNQWRFGTLRVVKEFVGTSSPYENFEFKVTQDVLVKYSGPFESDGDNEIIVGEGDYNVVETVTGAYTPSYSEDCSGTFGFEDSKTCVITNTFSVDPVVCEDPKANNYLDEGVCTYDEPNQCVPESPAWADTVVSANQGPTKGNGAITNPDRTDPAEALGAADWSNGGSTGFYSLDFGGSIVVSFDSYVSDVDGVDISIHEATNGANYPEETALVEVRQAGGDWYEVGTASNLTDVNTRVSYFDFTSTGLAWIDQVRVTDTTDSAPHNNEADGFDLDAVDASATVCTMPEPEAQCIVAGHKYDETGAPLEGWVIGLGGLFYEYTDNEEGGEYVYETYTDTTDENGYYCVAEYREQDEPGQNYIVGEVMKEGWSFVDATVDGASSTVTTTGDSFFDVWVDILLPEIGETRTVNFYNQDNGGGGTDGDTYKIDGYVWHDNNENTIWEGFPGDDDQEEDEATTTASTTEESLAGWTVTITNGSTSHSTTTDSDGYYYFEVPAGTWTINQEVQSGWKQIFPASNGHVVTVPEVVVQSLGARILALFIPTAHAAVVGTSGPHNFGNNESPVTVGGGCTSNCGGGPGRGPRTGSRPPSSSGGGSSEDAPAGEVLGEQVSVVPVGAADAGAGGGSPTVPTPAAMTLLFALAIMVSRNVRDAR